MPLCTALLLLAGWLRPVPPPSRVAAPPAMKLISQSLGFDELTVADRSPVGVLLLLSLIHI